MAHTRLQRDVYSLAIAARHFRIQVLLVEEGAVTRYSGSSHGRIFSSLSLMVISASSVSLRPRPSTSRDNCEPIMVYRLSLRTGRQKLIEPREDGAAD